MLDFYRQHKKLQINNSLKKQANAGQSFDKAFLVNEFINIGIKSGDHVLVHSSLSKIGHLANGPSTIIEALLAVIGHNGNLLMPTSPNNVLQLDYIKHNKNFDVLATPSKTGAITECFRQWKGAVRSAHPTEPVSVLGPLAIEYTKDHLGAMTPYQSDSPFGKLAKNNGKILYIGVTFDNAGTSLHTLEDAIPDFKFPVYHAELFEVTITDEKGQKHIVETKVHNPMMSQLRKCDQLIPHFKEAGVLTECRVGKADTLLVDASGFFDTMVELYKQKGITMYTPNGENLDV